jgi:hypothetical protein
MRTFVRLETVQSDISNRLTSLRNRLEDEINTKTMTGAFGGGSIRDEFHTVIRVFPIQDFQDYSSTTNL